LINQSGEFLIKKALITGITGQNGSYLSEFLLDRGYEVHGIKRRTSSLNTHRVDHIYLDRQAVNADNVSAGIASLAFVAFLSSLININFTTSQYAIFTSLMLFLPKIIGGYSGSIVDNFGYFNFFLLTAVIGIPVILLIVALKNKMYKS